MIFSNLIKLIHLITFGLLFTFFTACSDTATDTTSSTNTTTTYTLAGDVSQISTSTTSALIDASSSTTVPDLMIMVQNQFTNDVTFTQLESDGSFEIDVETSSTTSENVFFIALVNNDPLKYVAPLVGSIDSSTDTTAYSGIVIDNDYDDIDISYNSNTSIATLDSDTSITLNQSYKISLSDGSPIGMASNGKGSASQTTTLSTTNLLDPDMDGLPNIFDAMDDGQNLDNTSTNTATEAVAGSEIVDSAIMFMNYKIQSNQASTATITDNAIITIEVTASQPDEISSIVGYKVHENYENSVISEFPVGFTQIDTYPSSGSNWSDSSFSLYHAQNLDGQDIWTVFLKPQNNDFEPSNLIVLKATLTDGSTEYYWLSIHFKFQSFELANDTTTWLFGGAGDVDDPYCILDTGGRVFSWNAPQDETGTDLTGLNYDFELFYLAGTSPETAINPTDPQTFSLGSDVYYDNSSITQTVIDLYETESPSTNVLQLDIKASYEYGDNSALIIYMARKSWPGATNCTD